MFVLLNGIEEPKDLRKYFKKLLDEDKEIAEAAIKQSFWLAKYIWDKKKDILKKNGITWQMLMSAARDSFPLALAWIIDKLSWRELISYIDRQLENMAAISSAIR